MQSSSVEKAIEAQFDCLIKKVIKCEQKKYYMDFNVLGVKVQILDEQLSEFLEILPEMERNIILLSYFMDMSDSEIGQVMRVVRSTIYRHRKRTLEKIKKMYEEELGNEE